MGGTLAIGLAATNTGNNLLYLILAMMLSFIIVSGILSEQTLRRLHLARLHPRRIYAQAETPVQVIVRNGKRRLPSYSLLLAEAAAGGGPPHRTYLLKVPAGEQAIWSHRQVFPRRGRHLVPGITISTRFPFGLFLKATRPILADPVLVLPAVRPLARDELPPALGAGARPRPRRGRGTSLYNLRPYRPGDDLRLVHWRTTAKMGAPMVKELEDEETARVRLVLEDAPAPVDPQVVEEDITWAASLAAHLIRRGAEVQLALPEGETPYAAGEPHLYRILERLALYEPWQGSRGGPTAAPEGCRLVRLVVGRGSSGRGA